MRIVDVMLSLPILFVILVVANFLGRGKGSPLLIIVIFGLFSWMGVSRLVRSLFLSIREREFVEAARAVGVRDRRIIFRHILPNALSPIIVAASLIVGAATSSPRRSSASSASASTRPSRPGATSWRTPGRSSRRATGGGRSSRAPRSSSPSSPSTSWVTACATRSIRGRAHDRDGQRPGARSGRRRRRDALLDVRNLKTHFHVMDGIVPAVDGVSFSLGAARRSASSASRARARASPRSRSCGCSTSRRPRSSRARSGSTAARSSACPIDEMRKIRGNDIAMIFQEPLTSLNPVFTVGDQIAEQVELHKKVKQKEAWDRAIESLRLVGIPRPERRVKQYPHEMSGGMRQRVMIAMALSCEPKLLIADEPTTALDVTIQAQILELLKTIQERTGSALLLITHDLGVVAEMVDNIIVMYAGQIVEKGTVDDVLLSPRRPLHDGPARVDPDACEKRGGRLSVDQRARSRTRSTCRRPAGSSRAARTRGTCCSKRRRTCTEPAARASSPAAISTRRPGRAG